MITRAQLKEENRAQEASVMARRSKAKCLSCDRVMLENTRAAYESVAVADVGGTVGRGERETTRLAGTYGYHGTGICTLRCGFRWAHRRLSPEVSS